MASCRVVVESVADDEFAVLVADDDGVAHGAVGAAVVVRGCNADENRRAQLLALLDDDLVGKRREDGCVPARHHQTGVLCAAEVAPIQIG